MKNKDRNHPVYSNQTKFQFLYFPNSQKRFSVIYISIKNYRVNFF